MPDSRSLRAKLLAMASQSASPQEAAIARAMLENMPASAGGIETRRVLTREAILTSPAVARAGPRRGVAVRFPTGRWVHMYEDEANWELIESYRLPWRWEGDSMIHYPKLGVTPNRRVQLD